MVCSPVAQYETKISCINIIHSLQELSSQKIYLFVRYDKFDYIISSIPHLLASASANSVHNFCFIFSLLQNYYPERNFTPYTKVKAILNPWMPERWCNLLKSPHPHQLQLGNKQMIIFMTWRTVARQIVENHIFSKIKTAPWLWNNEMIIL